MGLARWDPPARRAGASTAITQGPLAPTRPVTGGTIQLKSEGTEVYFRRIMLRPIDTMLEHMLR
jgi:hypothetical protein